VSDEFTDEGFIRDRITSYREQIQEAHRAIKRIDEGMRFFEREDGVERDVTTQWRADVATRIAILDDCARMWEKELARTTGKA
jgi:hypothetical protein